MFSALGWGVRRGVVGQLSGGSARRFGGIWRFGGVASFGAPLQGCGGGKISCQGGVAVVVSSRLVSFGCGGVGVCVVVRCGGVWCVWWSGVLWGGVVWGNHTYHIMYDSHQKIRIHDQKTIDKTS